MKTLDRWEYRPTKATGAAHGKGSKSGNKAAARGIAYHRKFYKTVRDTVPRLFPEQKFYIEPWFQNTRTDRFRSPDAVLVDPVNNTAVVIEVKMNWKDGRDEKLIQEYLPIVKSAFELDCCWPLLVTQNLRGYTHPPLLWTPDCSPLTECLSWFPGEPTPLALFVR